MYRKMLVPLDGSSFAEVVFPYVKELAGRLGIDLVFLHVSSSKEGESFAPMHQAYIKQVADTIRRQARQVQGKTDKSGGREIEVTGEVVAGNPAEQILDYVDNNKVDLILVATHSRSGVRHWAMGSVADKILRMSKVPVWLVRAGISDETRYDKWPKITILVPLDGSELAESVLPHVEILARQRGPELLNVVLLRVCEPPTVSAYSAPQATGMPFNWVQDLSQEMISNNRIAGEYLAGVEKQLRKKQNKCMFRGTDG